MAKNWLSSFEKLEGAVNDDLDPHQNVLRTPSPSLNFIFGRGHGLPRGLSFALGGVPKGGKTLIANAMTGQIHKDDPEAIVFKFNTEFRERGQATKADLQRIWGIDPNRYKAFEVNSPMLIFDRIEQEFAAKCQEGMPLALVIIDSISGIQGRRAMNADTVETQQIGDEALTLGTGFKRILPIQRKYNFAILLTCQIAMEMDQLEQKRGNKVKMKMPLAVQHYAEYFGFVEPNRNKEGRTALDGTEFKNEDLGDVAGNADQTGHKIKVRMKDSSCGPKGRLAEFTIDYQKGIINVHEEAFLLGSNRGVIERVNNQVWGFDGKEYRSKAVMLEALKEPELQKAVIDEVFARDRAGTFTPTADEIAETEP